MKRLKYALLSIQRRLACLIGLHVVGLPAFYHFPCSTVKSSRCRYCNWQSSHHTPRKVQKNA
jgi:hypothetical protein